eukprot:2165732-Rhodomonas_salina.2
MPGTDNGYAHYLVRNRCAKSGTDNGHAGVPEIDLEDGRPVLLLQVSSYEPPPPCPLLPYAVCWSSTAISRILLCHVRYRHMPYMSGTRRSYVMSGPVWYHLHTTGRAVLSRECGTNRGTVPERSVG